MSSENTKNHSIGETTICHFCENKNSVSMFFSCIPASAGMTIFFLFFFIFFPSGLLALDGDETGKPIKVLSEQAASLDMIWTLIASFLIFLMPAGFTLVEVGFTRAKNAGTVVMKNMIGFALGAVGFFSIGYGLMFGASAFGLFGTSDFFLSHITNAGKVDNWKFANLMFQVVLAATAATIVSGAMSERAKFSGYLFYSVLISMLVYPVVGHWIWGGGWLVRIGVIDFSGSTVVHSVGGWVSLAGVLALGPRLSRYSRDGSVNIIPGHNIPLVALGVFIIWFGWFGFNTGNTLSAANPSIALIAVNTILAGASGALCAMTLTWARRGKPDAGMTMNGVLSGLVSCTGGVAIISPFSAAVIGCLSGFVLYFSLRGFERRRIDDPVGAISVHGLNGIWGTLAVGLFAEDRYVENSLGYAMNGLLFGGGIELLMVQALAVITVFLFAFPLSFGFFKLINAAAGLRVSSEEEVKGLDFGEHSMASYPVFDEFQKKQEEIIEELKRVRELSLLHDISQSMHTLNLDEILELILKGVARGIGFDRARLYLLDEGKNQLVCKVAVGVEKDKIQDISLPYDAEDNMVSRAIKERRPFIVEDASRDPRVNRGVINFWDVKSFAAAPLLSRDKVLGGISADNLISQTSITEKKLQSLMIFANQAAFALENALMYEELKAFSSQLEDRVKRATAELQETQRQLFQSEKLAALGKLSAGIAHEIRNPLTSIKILIHSLVDQTATEASRDKDLAVIEAEIERVNKIIKQFLDFARPRSPSLEMMDVRKVLKETIALIVYEMEAQGVLLERKDADEIPLLPMDGEQMKQVFLNLLLNGIQAMPQGGKLKVATAVKDPSTGNRGSSVVEISFLDSGEGIPEEVQNRIFEPFFSTKEEGIGLGLPIAQRIVAEHRGEIKVKSIPGKGAAFYITLPLYKRG
ncbi:MAG: ammonium transporter [Deltaproteobacteria bacterium]|nr:ammonium transporter [Deltaproteobacteria bacterium]